MCVCVRACVLVLRVCVTCKPIMCMYALAHNTCIHTYIASMRAIHPHPPNTTRSIVTLQKEIPDIMRQAVLQGFEQEGKQNKVYPTVTDVIDRYMSLPMTLYCVLFLLFEGASVCLLIDCVELLRVIQSSLKRQLECWPSEELGKQVMEVSSLLPSIMCVEWKLGQN